MAVHASSWTGGRGHNGSFSFPASILAGKGKPGCSMAGGALYAGNSVFTGGQGGDGFFDFDDFECKPPAQGGAGLWLAADAPAAGQWVRSASACSRRPPVSTS